MAIVVRIPTPLRKYTAGKAEVEAEGANVREVFESVESAYQGVTEKVFDDSGSIRRFSNVFVNGEDIRHLQGPDTTVKSGDELSIVPAIAGGSARVPPVSTAIPPLPNRSASGAACADSPPV